LGHRKNGKIKKKLTEGILSFNNEQEFLEGSKDFNEIYDLNGGRW
jgi:hypothetical protein